jgi:pimeloyl-ACP methyl ester carboxylesterase
MDELDLKLPGVRLHALASGPEDGELVLCAHGLSANARSWTSLMDALAARPFRVVALDLRGRGRSDVTPPGTYGLAAHASDVLAAADALGSSAFHLCGWSMGALIGLLVASGSPERVRTLTLVDHAGAMDASAVDAVRAGLRRLEAVVADPADYVAAIRLVSPIERWDDGWDAFYRYELAEREDGRWSPSTDAAACLEDLDQTDDFDWHARWRELRAPTLLLRCARPLNGGFIVPADEAREFAGAVPSGRVVEVDANHFDVMTDPAALDAMVALLEGGRS